MAALSLAILVALLPLMPAITAKALPPTPEPAPAEQRSPLRLPRAKQV